MCTVVLAPPTPYSQGKVVIDKKNGRTGAATIAKDDTYRSEEPDMKRHQ
jgi:hypothetical protein